MTEAEIRQFISHLAVDAKISASTQTQELAIVNIRKPAEQLVA
jgi:hypothetical protein